MSKLIMTGDQWHKTRCPYYHERPDPERPLSHIQFKCTSRSYPFTFCPVCPARARPDQAKKPDPIQTCFNFNALNPGCAKCRSRRTGPNKICYRPYKRTKTELYKARKGKRTRTIRDQGQKDRWEIYKKKEGI